MKLYFTKGVDRRYPNRWYLTAHPDARVVQYWPIKEVYKAKEYIKSLGFKPAESHQCTYTYKSMYSNKKIKDYNSRTLFIVFKNKADEASFIMHISDGIEV